VCMEGAVGALQRTLPHPYGGNRGAVVVGCRRESRAHAKGAELSCYLDVHDSVAGG
jgi:hypothetical protein